MVDFKLDTETFYLLWWILILLTVVDFKLDTETEAGAAVGGSSNLKGFAGSTGGISAGPESANVKDVRIVIELAT